jgi:hypothetical protein
MDKIKPQAERGRGLQRFELLLCSQRPQGQSLQYVLYRTLFTCLSLLDLEVSRLQKEVEALRVAAPLLSDGEPEDQPTLQRAANEIPQRDSGWPTMCQVTAA